MFFVELRIRDSKVKLLTNGNIKLKFEIICESVKLNKVT